MITKLSLVVELDPKRLGSDLLLAEGALQSKIH